MVKVLITSAGSINGINVIKALRHQKELRLSLLTADANPLNPSRYLADKFYRLPLATERTFIPSLLRICRREGVRLIIPTHSAEIIEMSKHKETLEKSGLRMAIPSSSVFDITWNKIKTATFFKEHDIPQPKTYTERELKRKRARLPLFIKKVSGSGTQEASRLDSWEDVKYHQRRIKENIIQQYIGGTEYTIDALGDLQGKMVAASPRVRLEIKGGLATKSITVANPKLVRYTKYIIETLGIVGPVCIQCKIEKRRPYFIDVNTRFPSGGLPLAVAAGFNIPLLVVKMLLGKPLGKITIKRNLVMIRYWDALFAEKRRADYAFRGFYHEFS